MLLRKRPRGQSKKKKSVTVRAKKAGKATLTAKVKIGKKIKKLKVAIRVRKKKSGTAVSGKKQPAFPGTVTTSLTSEGYVKLQWGKLAGATTYVIQRKSGNSAWEDIKVTPSCRYTDKKVAEYTKYSYRVKANRGGKGNPVFSDSVTVQTGEIAKPALELPSMAPTEAPEENKNDAPTVTPSEEPVPTPYQAKYHYEVSVLNQFNIYDSSEDGAGLCPIVLYIKTDNPNPNGGETGVPVDVVDEKGNLWGGIGTMYEDIEYQEQEETYATFYWKVEGGWIYTLNGFDSPGIKKIYLEEGFSDDECALVPGIQLEVKDGKKALKEHCNKVIQTVSVDNYNEDGRGKWSEMSMPDKLERLEDYIRGTMHYPLHGALTALGYIRLNIIQENVGAYFETGFADCGASNELMCALARTLGLEAKRKNTVSDGQLHIVAAVTIDGKEYLFDATPWQGGYKDWEYLDLSKY